MNGTATHRHAATGVSRHVVIALWLPLIAAYTALFAYAMQSTSYDVWGALWLAPLLIAISVPVLRRSTRNEPDKRIFHILVAALLVKLVASIPRYFMVLYYESGDSLRYDETARQLREAFLSGDFSLVQLGADSWTGTQFLEIVTGVVYTAIGPSFIGGYFLFSWLGFWGLFFFYRAFRVAVPDGNRARYAVLLFFLPSMLFWPSSIGKEAFMTLAVGLATYGCALFLTRRLGAFVCLALGLAGVLAVRPHVGLLIVAGLGVGYVLRSFGAQRAVAMGKFRTVVGLAAIGAVTLLVIQQASQFLEIEDLNVDSATGVIEGAGEQTGQGGSEFEGVNPSFQNLPLSIVTVLFRPFLFEANSLQTLLTAAEGMALLGVFILSLPRMRTLPKRIFQQSYISYCVTYSILFCFAFSTFQNFGILARERVMVYPLVLVLMALPFVKVSDREKGATVEGQDGSDASTGDQARAESNVSETDTPVHVARRGSRR